jgi:hypothetical protein
MIKRFEEECYEITKRGNIIYLLSSLAKCMYIYIHSVPQSLLVLFILFVTLTADLVKESKKAVEKDPLESRVFLSWRGRVTPLNENKTSSPSKIKEAWFPI